MSDIREIPSEHTRLAGPALLELRPQWESVAALVEVVETRLRPAGYRLLGAFESEAVDPGEPAVAVAGFRIGDALAWGRILYVDDLSTLPAHRGAGHADRLLRRLRDEAVREGCDGLHLDSGVGADRAAAHRLYMRHHLRISAHHFHDDLQ